MDEIGPVDYAVIAFPGNRFRGEIGPALSDLVDNGTIRIIDIAFVGKNPDGDVVALELTELDPDVQASLDSAAFTDSSHASQGACSKNGDGGKRYRLTSRRGNRALGRKPDADRSPPAWLPSFHYSAFGLGLHPGGANERMFAPRWAGLCRNACDNFDALVWTLPVGKEAGERPGRSARGAMARYHFV